MHMCLHGDVHTYVRASVCKQHFLGFRTHGEFALKHHIILSLQIVNEIARDAAIVPDPVTAIAIAPGIAVITAIRGASPHFIGMYRHRDSSTSPPCSTKPCRRPDKSRPALCRIRRKRRCPWSVRQSPVRRVASMSATFRSASPRRK